MKRLASGKAAFALSCLVVLPLLAFAQDSRNPTPPPASSLVAGLNLPGAPAPQNQSQPPAKQKQTQQPNNGLSVQDLGFTPQQTQANAQLQARLNKRTHMLKVHQTLGLITLAPLVATVAVSGGAKEKHSKVPGQPSTGPSSSGVDLHVALGSGTVVMYASTAYFAIAAPKIPGVKPTGAIRLHRDLVWIHLPGMILTPILGSMALNQENQGEKVHGLASAHQYVAITTVGAYAASIVAVSWPIHWKFWEKQ